MENTKLFVANIEIAKEAIKKCEEHFSSGNFIQAGDCLFLLKLKIQFLDKYIDNAKINY